MCGKLFCRNGKDSPNYGRMVTIGDCKASFFEDFTKDFGQVDTGTKCGDGKVSSAALLLKALCEGVRAGPGRRPPPHKSSADSSSLRHPLIIPNLQPPEQNRFLSR